MMIGIKVIQQLWKFDRQSDGSALRREKPGRGNSIANNHIGPDLSTQRFRTFNDIGGEWKLDLLSQVFGDAALQIILFQIIKRHEIVEADCVIAHEEASDRDVLL